MISLHHWFWIGRASPRYNHCCPRNARCWPAMVGHITHCEKGVKPAPLETEMKMVLAQRRIGIQFAEDRWLNSRKPKQHAVCFGRKERFHGYPWHLILHKQLKDKFSDFVVIFVLSFSKWYWQDYCDRKLVSYSISHCFPFIFIMYYLWYCS